MTTNSSDANWQKQPGCLFFLANFIRPYTLDDLSTLPNLADILGEPPEQVVQQLLEAGALQYVDPAEPPEQVFARVRVRELQDLLAERRLPVSGRKQELIHRLAHADPDALYRAALRKTPLCCTDEGRRISEDYLTTKGCSLRRDLNLPDDWWLKFILQIAEWVAAGVLGNAVYDALTKAGEETQPEAPEPTPTLAPTAAPPLKRRASTEFGA